MSTRQQQQPQQAQPPAEAAEREMRRRIGRHRRERMASWLLENDDDYRHAVAFAVMFLREWPNLHSIATRAALDRAIETFRRNGAPGGRNIYRSVVSTREIRLILSEILAVCEDGRDIAWDQTQLATAQALNLSPRVLRVVPRVSTNATTATQPSPQATASTVVPAAQLTASIAPFAPVLSTIPTVPTVPTPSMLTFTIQTPTTPHQGQHFQAVMDALMNYTAVLATANIAPATPSASTINTTNATTTAIANKRETGSRDSADAHSADGDRPNKRRRGYTSVTVRGGEDRRKLSPAVSSKPEIWYLRPRRGPQGLIERVNGEHSSNVSRICSRKFAESTRTRRQPLSPTYPTTDKSIHQKILTPANGQRRPSDDGRAPAEGPILVAKLSELDPQPGEATSSCFNGGHGPSSKRAGSLLLENTSPTRMFLVVASVVKPGDEETRVVVTQRGVVDRSLRLFIPPRDWLLASDTVSKCQVITVGLEHSSCMAHLGR
ncbi:uncharacterized protein EV422DRAFT_580471 [Fimicolochytrium jonesii]|uniref:uncharacterized protein n=1 Tax=Fimicolochytrium jonesii TaxID=1396493 RepID=UPI0022FE9E55|nr:uncharacterized protein EV422DRAFT_580471 [Fimicolochytrium jonesii]KAI8817833.1 hypothetical protein EV422DRAFT_580471 [Fimicolochytrium jonesii]